MKDLVKAFIENLETLGYSPRTRELYDMCLRRCLQHSGESPAEITITSIDSFLLQLRRAGRSESTIRVYYEAIKRYFYFLGRKGELPRKQFRPTQRRLPVILNPEEITRILGACSNLKIQSVIALAYSAGLRISEIINLTIADLDFKRGTIHIRNGKNRKDRYSILSQKAAIIIKSYIAIYRSFTLLFPSPIDQSRAISCDCIHRQFKKTAARAGIMKSVSIHSLRHAFATHLLENGTNIFQVKELLGHESLKTTLLYLHVRPFDLSKIVSPMDVLSEISTINPWPHPSAESLLINE